MPIWRRLLMQEVCWPLDLARDNAGKSMAAKMAMIAITTSNSIRVKARRGRFSLETVVGLFISAYKKGQQPAGFAQPSPADKRNLFLRRRKKRKGMQVGRAVLCPPRRV